MAAITHHEELIVLPRNELRGEMARIYDLEMVVNRLELRLAVLEGQVAFLAQLLQDEKTAGGDDGSDC